MIKQIICIVGPTASGKTSLGIALAKKINGEIISADSMQIYKGLDIATAKVTKEEQREITHHIIDICEIYEKFSVANFKAMCYDKIDEIIKRGKVPIIVGGTGLYISSIVNNMNFTKELVNEEYRNYLYKIAEEKSKEDVYNILKEIDPNTAKEIHPNNLKRVIRAIEIAKFSDKLKSVHIESENERIKKNAMNKFKVFYVDIDRKILYERINNRVDEMIKSGLLIEAKKVYDMKLDKSNTCMQAIGYKEFFDYFEEKKTLEESIEKLKQETRKYAKRQITWFKNKLDIAILNGIENKENLVNEILKNIV